MARLSHRDGTELLTRLRHDVLGRHPVPWDEWERHLAGLDGRDWLLLDKLARRETWTPAIMHGVRGWDTLDLSRAATPALVAAAMHVDGRLRERAVRALAGRGGPVASAALGLRLLDHVSVVASEARVVVEQHRGELALDVVMDVLVNGADRRTAGGRWTGLVDDLGLDTPPVLERLRATAHRAARRWAVQRSLDQGLLDEDAVVHLATSDRDQWLRRVAAEHLGRAPSPARLASLLDARSVEARLTAVTRMPEELLDGATLERVLLDRSPRVREQARWRARRRGLDVAEVCRRRLGDPAPQVVAAALDGLAWTGDEVDVEAVGDLLHHPASSVRAAAVRTFAARAPPTLAVPTLAPLLDDPSGRVSAAAATVLARAGAAPSFSAEAWESSRPTARRAAWRVVRAAGGWARVAADLRAASDPDAHLAGLGRDGLRSWLLHGAASTWGRPDAEQARAMAEHLSASGLSPTDAELVAFHAGLPFAPVAFTSAAAPGETHPDGPSPGVASPRRERRGFWRLFGRSSG